MFQTLDEQIRIDELKTSTKQERVIRLGLIVLLSVVLFAALYFGLHMVEGS